MNTNHNDDKYSCKSQYVIIYCNVLPCTLLRSFKLFYNYLFLLKFKWVWLSKLTLNLPLQSCRWVLFYRTRIVAQWIDYDNVLKKKKKNSKIIGIYFEQLISLPAVCAKCTWKKRGHNGLNAEKVVAVMCVFEVYIYTTAHTRVCIVYPLSFCVAGFIFLLTGRPTCWFRRSPWGQSGVPDWNITGLDG